ncbi:MAG TPA: PASTA domain-containing protein [Citricoccus sp.]
MTERRADPLTGTVIEGRYEIRSRLARGGMSTVYLAVDRRLDREVALKVLYPHLAESHSLVQRFEQEAKTAARLSHPHVVNVLDQGVDHSPDGDLAYLVMEYVPGYTLRTVLQRRQAMTPRVALAYLEAIVDGLAAAHRAGLVHRDVKPENVLVSRDGQIKVADFGLARATTDFTGTGAALMGTVAYISPELVSGSPADERSDIYAVGILAYEMLTGRQPFAGASPIQVAYQHVNNEVPPPSGRVPGLAEALDRLVLWCTARNPRDRPADAGVLLTEVRHLRSSMADPDLDFEPPALAAGPAAEHPTEAFGGLAAHEDEDGGDQGRDGDRDRDPHENTHENTHDTGELLDREEDLDGLNGPGDLGGLDGLDDAQGFTRPQDATEVIGRPGVTEALDPAATTVLPTPDSHRTSVLPGLPAAPGRQPLSATRGAGPAPAADAPVAPEATGMARWLPWSRGGSGRPASTRQQRRQQQRRARTPTEDLGHRSSTRMWAWAAIVIIATATLVLAGWFFGSGPGAVVVVPDVAGHSRGAAVDALEATGVGYTLTRAHDDMIAEDSVISMDPGPGTQLRRYDTVRVTVSSGPQLLDVPDVAGLDRAQAARALEAAGLGLGQVTHEHSGTVEAGQVVRQVPDAGAGRRRGHPVAVVLSDGPATVAVPDVTGRPEPEARRLLGEAGLEADTRNLFGGLLGDHSGRVRHQSPAPGTEVQPGTAVRLVTL